MSRIYRQASLDKLSSPEQLDRPVRLTSARSFLSIAFIMIILAVLVIWGFTGTIPEKVKGQGMIMSSGGIVFVQSHVSGVLSDVAIEKGDYVNIGDVIARTDETDIVSKLTELEREMNSILQKSELQQSANDKSNYKLDIKRTQEQIDAYKEKLNKLKVICPAQGKVLTISMKKNSVVEKGQVITSILQKGSGVNNTTVLFYLPIERGKGLTPGMKANIYPSIYNRQEYGHMEAIVTEVSEYAITANEIRETLGNDELVKKFSQMGVLVEVKANLRKDKDTVSGFYWSSKKGKKLKVEEGIICDVSVTVEEKSPVSLIIPFLKKKILP